MRVLALFLLGALNVFAMIAGQPVSVWDLRYRVADLSSTFHLFSVCAEGMISRLAVVGAPCCLVRIFRSKMLALNLFVLLAV